MAGIMDMLLSQGWMPPQQEAPAGITYDENGMPIDSDAMFAGVAKKKSPFPDVKPPITQWGPFAGLVAPNVSGQISQTGGDGDYHPDPMMPGTSTPAISAGSVPIPRPRPESASAPATPPEVPTREVDGSPSNSATDVSSSNRGSVRPQSPADPDNAPGMAPQTEPAGQSIFGRLGNFLQNNSNTLLALGAGFAGAPNIGQGISRAAAAAIPAAQADIKQRTLLQSQGATFRALIDAGVPPNQALGAISNPELMKALIPAYITDRKMEIKTVKSKNAWGEENERLVAVNPYDPRQSIDLTPHVQAAASQITGGGSSPTIASPDGTQSAFYAPGVTDQTVDQTKVGDDYLRQFSPEVQQYAKDYLAGRAAPTGRQAIMKRVEMIAHKYGNDIGMPADPALIGQRKQWATSLGNTQSGIGLQAKGFQQGLEHFVKLSDNLVKMNLSNGLGFEPAAGWANYFKSLSPDQQELIHKSDVIGQALSREMGNLFSKNGGGVHEAASTKAAISNAYMSSKSAAGSLEAIDELMQGGLKTLERRRDELFPNGDAPRGSNFNGPEQQAALQHIRKNIAILKGEAKPEAASAAAAAAPKPGRYRWDPATNAMVPIQ